MEQTIERYEALKEIDAGNTFSLVFITANRKKGTGGKRISVTNWIKVTNPDVEMPLPGRELTQAEKANLRGEFRKKTTISFNIMDPNNARQHITHVHYSLMTFFNGKRIIG